MPYLICLLEFTHIFLEWESNPQLVVLIALAPRLASFIALKKYNNSILCCNVIAILSNYLFLAKIFQNPYRDANNINNIET